MSGKGSRARPFSVDQKTFDNNWDATFGKKEKEPTAEDLSAYDNERLVSKYDKQDEHRQDD